MSRPKKLPWGILVGLLAGLVLTLWGWFILGKADKSRTELPVLGQVPAFQFIERSGDAFGQQDFRGKISVVDFFFTRCMGICPVMASKYQQLYAAFTNDPRVQLVSISVDPEYDTPMILTQYAREQGVTDNRWLFLNGKPSEVMQLCEQGFMLPADNLPMGHSAKFSLVDGQGRIRGYYDSSGDMALLITHIQQLLRERKSL